MDVISNDIAVMYILMPAEVTLKYNYRKENSFMIFQRVGAGCTYSDFFQNQNK